MTQVLESDTLLQAYAMGVFPMAESRDDPDIHWVEPRMRGILPLDAMHISRSMRKFLRQCPFQIRVDSDFTAVMEGCADRPETWINQPIVQVFTDLHRRGYAHSVECWQDGELVGGLYGLALGGAFFGESMFSRRTNASKAALVHLTGILRLGGYRLLDTQFMTGHLTTLGGIEITRMDYLQRLQQALAVPVDTRCWQVGFGQFDEKG